MSRLRWKLIFGLKWSLLRKRLIWNERASYVLSVPLRLSPEKRQLSLAKRRETSEMASRRLAKNGELLEELQSRLPTMTVEIKERHKLATETAEELKGKTMRGTEVRVHA